MADENLPMEAVKSPVPIVDGVLAPTDLDGLWRLTSIICKTKIAGDYQNKTEEAFVAIQLGMSVGLNYMQSLQSVAVINKKPSLYGDATTAICIASGQLEEHDEYWELGEERMEDYDGPADLKEWPDDLKAVVMMKRYDVKQPKISKFSVGDAKRMQKWDKYTDNGNLSVWQKHPKDMLMWRARHKTQSVVFADVLKGFVPAKIAADYDTTDLEPTNGDTYEVPTEKAKQPATEKAKVPSPEGIDANNSSEPASAEKKEIAREMQFLIDFCKTEHLSLSRLEEFVGVIAKENGTTLGGLIPDIQARKDEFISMFKKWDETTGGYVGQPDNTDSGPSVDDKSVSEPDPPKNEPQIPPEEDPVALRAILDLALELYVSNTPDAFIDSDTESNMDAYLTYCAEITKRTNLEVLKLARNNPDNYCEYFFQWLAANPIKKEEPEPVKEARDPRGDVTIGDNNKPFEEPVKEPEPAKKKAYSDFVLEFKNMTAPRFKNWVESNKDRLEAADIEDFKEAVRKWEAMRSQGKLNDEWPYPQKQLEIGFDEGQTGALNARQRVANLKQTNPTEAEMARKKLGFATAVGEEAAAIWEEKIHEIIEDKAKKAARGKKK